jgi:hypothetical protein
VAGRLRNYTRGWRVATWALVAWFVVALLLAGYAFLQIYVAPNGCPAEEGIASFCRYVRMKQAFGDFTLAIAAYCAGAVVLGALWLFTAPSHGPCPNCGSSARTDAGTCRRCGHDFFATQLKENAADDRPQG